MIHPTRPTVRPCRRGFTLIELLVVIAIIAVLLGLSTAAVMAVMTSQIKSATKTTLNKVANILSKQWKAAIDQANEEFRAFNPNNPDPNIAAAYQATGGNPDLAKNLYVQMRLQQEFPTSLAEAANPVVYSANGATISLPSKYTRAVAGLSSVGQPQPAMWESSVCLCLALSKARRGEGDTLNLEDGVGAGTIQTVNGAKVLVDNYGTPIDYTRGANNSSPQVRSAGPNQKPNDADDIVSTPQFK
jgi:prepilin-type N-terminal cleavage/methylation domain-containing protein